MIEMVTSGSMSGERKRSDGLLGESGHERRRSHSAPPVLHATAPFLDSTTKPPAAYRDEHRRKAVHIQPVNMARWCRPASGRYCSRKSLRETSSNRHALQCDPFSITDRPSLLPPSRVPFLRRGSETRASSRPPSGAAPLDLPSTPERERSPDENPRSARARSHRRVP